MVVIRCTRKLLARLPHPIIDAPGPSDTALGDWYAKLLFTRNLRLVHMVNQRSLLSLLLPVRDLKSLHLRFVNELRLLLVSLNVHRSAVKAELAAMDEVCFSKTTSRTVLGSMNDLSFQARAYFDDTRPVDLNAVALSLSRVPCSPIGMNYPRDVALAILREHISGTGIQ